MSQDFLGQEDPFYGTGEQYTQEKATKPDINCPCSFSNSTSNPFHCILSPGGKFTAARQREPCLHLR